MGSYFEDPNQWRLRSNNGVVPFKMVQQQGTFDAETAGITITGLIPAVDLYTFLVETFPAPIALGGMTIPRSSSLPGLPALQAKKVSFRSQDTSKPCDPFGFDPNAPAGTYHPIIEVEIEYGASPKKEDPNPDDPRTFLEISSNASGEFIHTTAPQAKIDKKTDNPDNDSDDNPPRVTGNKPTKPGTSTGEKPDIKDPTVPINIIVPNTEWTLKWKQVPYNYFQNTLSYRLRWAVGHVNSAIMPVFFHASVETILFSGWSHTESYTWRNGVVGTPPIDVEMKFVEKRLIWKGLLVGHNHFWIPGKGWERVLIDGEIPTYQQKDLSLVFRIT